MFKDDKNNILIIPIETKVREFYGKLLLAHIAAKSGYRVFFGDQSTVQDIVDLLPRGIYLSKSVAATTVEMYERLQLQGFTPVAWDEEGLLYFSSEVYHKLRLNRQSLQQVKLFFCWGDKQRNDIVSFYPDIKNKLCLSGNPRFDLLRKDFLSFHSQKVTEYSREFGKIILLNTNFGFFNHFRSRGQVEAMLANFPLSSEPGFVDGWIEYQHKAFDAFRELLPVLSAKYPEYSIVVRPHPSEKHFVWEELSQSYENVFMRADGNVHEWILASDVLIHSNCTTAVEAFILGVPPVNYRPTQKTQYEHALPKIVSWEACDLSEVLSGVEQAIHRPTDFTKQIWTDKSHGFVKQYVTGLDGQLAAERVVDRIKELSISSEHVSTAESVLRLVKLNWRKILFKYRQLAAPSDGYCEHKQPGFSEDEICEVLKRFDEVLKTKCEYEVNRCFKNVYEIKLLKKDF